MTEQSLSSSSKPKPKFKIRHTARKLLSLERQANLSFAGKMSFKKRKQAKWSREQIVMSQHKLCSKYTTFSRQVNSSWTCITFPLIPAQSSSMKAVVLSYWFLSFFTFVTNHAANKQKNTGFFVFGFSHTQQHSSFIIANYMENRHFQKKSWNFLKPWESIYVVTIKQSVVDICATSCHECEPLCTDLYSFKVTGRIFVASVLHSSPL